MTETPIHDAKEDIHPSPKITTDSSHSETLMIENLDRILSRFGEASFCPLPTKADDNKNKNVNYQDKSETNHQSWIRRFAPIGLEDSFQQLYSILFPCLCQQESATSSAILMGPRGCGKSLLVERCIAACTLQNAKFRKVHINGICIRGEDVPSVVFEIIRQLSDLALEESHNKKKTKTKKMTMDDGPPSDHNPTTQNDDTREVVQNLKRQRTENYLWRLRKSSFTSNLSLLETTFKMAEADGIPILLILDELDSFTDEADRQLLLYHLLDRVATPGSNLCLIGLTSNFTTLGMLEKRIRSRAEGTCKVVYIRPPSSYNRLLEILEQKLDGCLVKTEIMNLLSLPKNIDKKEEQESSSRRVALCMEREFRLGKDLRWYSHVLSCALSLYRHDCQEESSKLVKFKPSYLLDALEVMGASISDDSSIRHDLCMVNGVAVDPRLQALLDLSTPQVALLLSARRILAREAHRDNMAAPLTIQRMLKEYESYRRGATLPSLQPAVWQLLERGLLVPSADHSGWGPLQYQASFNYKNLDSITLSRLPLHMPIEIDRELGEALNKNLLDCPTTLREWGRKCN